MSGGGGGGGSQTTQSGIDPEFKPYLKRVLSDVTDRYESEVAAGPDKIVAALDPRQEAAIDAQTALGQQMISGTGKFDTRGATERALANVRGRQLGGLGSNISSARAMRSADAALADKAMEFAKDEQQTALMGVDTLGKAGTTMQQYEQQRLDAPHTSASRYFGYLQNAPQQQTTTSSGGGK